MNYADKAAALDARADDLEGRLATFAAEARKHAVAASAGDRDALRRIWEIDSTCDAMRREANTARVAAEQLRERERAAAAERERADQERRHAAARQLADQVLALNVEIDSGFAQLAGLFAQRAELINQLAGPAAFNRTSRAACLTASVQPPPRAEAVCIGTWKSDISSRCMYCR